MHPKIGDSAAAGMAQSTRNAVPYSHGNRRPFEFSTRPRNCMEVPRTGRVENPSHAEKNRRKGSFRVCAETGGIRFGPSTPHFEQAGAAAQRSQCHSRPVSQPSWRVQPEPRNQHQAKNGFQQGHGFLPPESRPQPGYGFPLDPGLAAEPRHPHQPRSSEAPRFQEKQRDQQNRSVLPVPVPAYQNTHEFRLMHRPYGSRNADRSALDPRDIKRHGLVIDPGHEHWREFKPAPRSLPVPIYQNRHGHPPVKSHALNPESRGIL